MTYLRQGPTLARLDQAFRRRMRKTEAVLTDSLFQDWTATRDDLKLAIITEYRRSFGNDRWNLPRAKLLGALYRIERTTREHLDVFLAHTTKAAGAALGRIRHEEALGAAWLLDQTTPPHVKVRIPPHLLREAQVYTGAEAAVQWTDRWAHWVDAYGATLNRNILLGALNESSVMDAADEVDASRPGSPSVDLFSVLSRIFSSEAIAAGAEAREEIAEANDDIVLAEIWQTLEDARVCDQCDPNDGLERDEVDDDIPAHPNCRCFWRLVPQQWADLLKEDPDTAREMDRRGLVPDAMALWDDKEQEMTGAVIVDFDKWQDERMAGISGGL